MKHKPPRKPDWLKVRFPAGPRYSKIDRYHREQGLHSVCRSAACPNQGECWSKGTATFMILGEHCTRNCRFCNVSNAVPRPVDPEEPRKVARAIAELELNHAVITAVTRDDLPDGGAGHFAGLVEEIRRQHPSCIIELLISDLAGNWQALQTILDSRPDILGHNLETVPRLYHAVRSEANYQRSLELLREADARAPQIPSKSGLMLGLGETEDELLAVMHDLREVNCQLLTLGQYLQPSRDHQPVARFVPPEEFTALKEKGLQLGFRHIEAGPLVRSSYHAAEQFQEAQHGDQ